MRYASTSVTERLRPSWQCTSAAPPAAAAAPMKRAASSKKRSMSSSSTSRSGQRMHLRRAAHKPRSPQNPVSLKPYTLGYPTDLHPAEMPAGTRAAVLAAPSERAASVRGQPAARRGEQALNKGYCVPVLSMRKVGACPSSARQVRRGALEARAGLGQEEVVGRVEQVGDAQVAEEVQAARARARLGSHAFAHACGLLHLGVRAASQRASQTLTSTSQPSQAHRHRVHGAAAGAAAAGAAAWRPSARAPVGGARRACWPRPRRRPRGAAAAAWAARSPPRPAARAAAAACAPAAPAG